jgi:hypothetical protein
MKQRIPKLDNFIFEKLPTKEIDPEKFPNPGRPNDKDFFIKGKQDGEAQDDIVHSNKVSIPAKSLKPSQDAIYLGKSVGMAIHGVEGGDLEAVISDDNRILDGHHRWAATMLNNPDAKINGTKSNLKIGDLIPVLRQAGDALGNKRGLAPEHGDINIYDATIEDIENCVYTGKNMEPKWYNTEKSIKWFEKIGKENIEKRLKSIQRTSPPDGAPPRAEMPKIKPDQVNYVATNLNGGKIDVRAPYKNEGLIPSFDNYLAEENILEDSHSYSHADHPFKRVIQYFKKESPNAKISIKRRAEKKQTADFGGKNYEVTVNKYKFEFTAYDGSTATENSLLRTIGSVLDNGKSYEENPDYNK